MWFPIVSSDSAKDAAGDVQSVTRNVIRSADDSQTPAALSSSVPSSSCLSAVGTRHSPPIAVADAPHVLDALAQNFFFIRLHLPPPFPLPQRAIGQSPITSTTATATVTATATAASSTPITNATPMQVGTVSSTAGSRSSNVSVVPHNFVVSPVSTAAPALALPIATAAIVVPCPESESESTVDTLTAWRNGEIDWQLVSTLFPRYGITTLLQSATLTRNDLVAMQFPSDGESIRRVLAVIERLSMTQAARAICALDNTVLTCYRNGAATISYNCFEVDCDDCGATDLQSQPERPYFHCDYCDDYDLCFDCATFGRRHKMTKSAQNEASIDVPSSVHPVPALTPALLTSPASSASTT